MDHHTLIVEALREAADARERRLSTVSREDRADFCHEIRVARQFANEIEDGRINLQVQRPDHPRPADDPKNFTDLINVLRDIQDCWPGLDRFLLRPEAAMMRLDADTLIRFRSHLIAAQMRINRALDATLKTATRMEWDRTMRPIEACVEILQGLTNDHLEKADPKSFARLRDLMRGTLEQSYAFLTEPTPAATKRATSPARSRRKHVKAS